MSDIVSNSNDSWPHTASIVHRAFSALCTTLTDRNVRYAIIGGIAVIHHSRVRTTEDIDVLIDVPQIAMPGLFHELRDRGFNLDVATAIRELRDDGLTDIEYQNVVVVDLMRPLVPAYSHVLDRAITANVFDLPVRVGSAEGLIVTKMIALRPQDELDVQALLGEYRGTLDLDYVRKELKSIYEPNDPRWAKLEQWIRDSKDAD